MSSQRQVDGLIRILGLLLGLLFVVSTANAQVTITGSFKNPDGTAVSGRVLISLARPTVTVSCPTTQVVTLRQVTVRVTSGTLGSLSLYPSTAVCMSPTQNYVVYVYDSGNRLLYKSFWSVPNVGSIDVSLLDTNQ